MIRGRHGSVEFLRGAFNPVYCRSLSTASIRFADDKNRVNKSSLLSWIKDVFSKSGRNVGGIWNREQPATTTTTSTPLNQPEITIRRSEREGWNETGAGTKMDRATAVNPKLEWSAAPFFKLDKEKGRTGRTRSKSVPDFFQLKNRRTLSDSADKSGGPCEASIFTVDFVLGDFNWRQLKSFGYLKNWMPGAMSSRNVTSYAPGSSKPPIREPNTPDKREKKDPKKEKKNKKPVIRTEEVCFDRKLAKDSLNSNFYSELDPDKRLLESQDEKHETYELKQLLRTSLDQTKPNSDDLATSLTDRARSTGPFEEMLSYMHTSAMSNKNVAEASKETPVASVKEVEVQKIEPKMAQMAGTVFALDKSKVTKETEGKKSTGGGKDSIVLDQDYNIPPETGLDAELTAWRDVAMRSKIPVEQPTEQVEESGKKRVEMVSIRPEPPRPKLDVQAVPSNVLDPSEVQEEPETGKSDTKAGKSEAKSETRQIPGPGGLHPRLDTQSSKKLHTTCVPTWTCQENVHQVSSFSTGPKDSSGPVDQSRDDQTVREAPFVEKETEPKGADKVSVKETSQGSSAMAGGNIEGRIDEDPAERESEIPPRASLDRPAPVTNDQTRYNNNNDQGFNYSSGYEDDFYPGYESISNEAESRLERNQRQMSERGSTTPGRPSSRMEEIQLNSGIDQSGAVSDNYVVDGNFVKIPGDPYPFSREHFYKWRLPYVKTEEIGLDGQPNDTSGLLKPTKMTLKPSDMNLRPPTRDMSSSVNDCPRKSKDRGPVEAEDGRAN